MSRRRAHIAMVGVPIVSHVLASPAVIRELVARGHRVTFANDPFVADLVESTGAELVRCTSTLPVADNNRPADPVSAASLFLDDAVQALPQLRAAYDGDPAKKKPGQQPGPRKRTRRVRSASGEAAAASCVRRTRRGCQRPPDHRGQGGAERAYTQRVHRREPGQS